MAIDDLIGSPPSAAAIAAPPDEGHQQPRPGLLGDGAAAFRAQRSWFLPSLPLALVTFGICLYMLGLPNVLYGTNQYDDGVYVGAALRLTHGVIPYRDFVIVHPPGILILMTPAALIGRVLGSNVALALGRELTAVVASVNVMLAAAVVRRRGWKVSLVAATAAACFPMTPAADSTVFLEPYLVFFCLLGLALLFSEGRIASPRRCAVAGACIGFAGSVKVWAAVVALTAVVVCLRPTHQRRLVSLIGGLAAGFAVPCLPFFLSSPHAFVRDILGDQYSRAVAGGASTSWGARIANLTGINGITAARIPTVGAVLILAASAVLVGFVLIRARRCLRPVDYAVVAGAGASAIVLCLPHEMYAHYVYFSAPFLAMALATCLGALGETRAHRDTSGFLRRSGLAVAGCFAAVTLLVPQQAGYARSHLTSSKDPTFLNLFVSPDACTLTDDISLLVSADLFEPGRKGCPPVTDAFGVWLADGPKQEPAYSGTAKFGSTVQGPFSAKFTNEWSQWLSKADYVVTLAQYSGYVPWNDSLAGWFNASFKPIYHQPHLWIYKRTARLPAPLMG